MGALAESFGVRAGLKYRKPIKDELETVLRLDPAFQQGSADRALGRWYFKVPGLFGGSHKLAEAAPARVADVQPDTAPRRTSSSPKLLLDDGRKDEARAELQKVLDAPLDPDWAPEDQEFKDKARRRCTARTLKSSRSFERSEMTRRRTQRKLTSLSSCRIPGRSCGRVCPASTIRLSSGGGAYAGSRNSSNMMLAM